MLVDNRFTALFILYLLAVPLLAAEPANPVEQEVLAADLQRFEAMIKSDVAALELVLAPETIYVNRSARIDDKQSILYAIRTKTTSYQSIVATERKARVTGTAGVVRGVAAIRGVERKENVDFTVRYMAVYVKRNGRWQMTAGQDTQLVPTSSVISGQPA
jgi:hypothetical protein